MHYPMITMNSDSHKEPRYVYNVVFMSILQDEYMCIRRCITSTSPEYHININLHSL
jgi:hypothetical protein